MESDSEVSMHSDKLDSRSVIDTAEIDSTV